MTRYLGTGALAVVAATFAGCGVTPTGYTAPYRALNPHPVDITIAPEAFSITQQFRPTEHFGIDIIGPVGAPVLAAAEGVVGAVWTDPLYGLQVEITHVVTDAGQPVKTIYRHLSATSVEVGDHVARGAVIGRLGISGMLSGGIPHVHFEAHLQGRNSAVDPNLYWADGQGHIACFNPATTPKTGLIFPVACGAAQAS